MFVICSWRDFFFFCSTFSFRPPPSTSCAFLSLETWKSIREWKKAGETDDALLSGFPSRAHTVKEKEKEEEKEKGSSLTTLCCYTSLVPAPFSQTLIHFPCSSWTRGWKQNGPNGVERNWAQRRCTQAHAEKVKGEGHLKKTKRKAMKKKKEFRLGTLLDSHANNTRPTRQLGSKDTLLLLSCCKPSLPPLPLKMHMNFQSIYYYDFNKI